MSSPTPPPPATIEVVARLLPVHLDAEVLPTSWYVTHTLGGPAANTYTEVRIAPGVEQPEHVLDSAVLRVADELYGRRYAFHYRPDQYADSIAPYRMRRREVVLVESVEVYS